MKQKPIPKKKKKLTVTNEEKVMLICFAAVVCAILIAVCAILIITEVNRPPDGGESSSSEKQETPVTFRDSATDLEYIVTSENTVGVYFYHGIAGADVVIPATVTYQSKTYTVTSITECAFLGGLPTVNHYPSSVTIPITVTKIEASAFGDCQGLVVHYAGTETDWMQIQMDKDSQEWLDTAELNFKK